MSSFFDSLYKNEKERRQKVIEVKLRLQQQEQRKNKKAMTGRRKRKGQKVSNEVAASAAATQKRHSGECVCIK